MGVEQLEGRNVVIEALRRGRRTVRQILIDQRAKPDRKLEEIQRLARNKKIKVSFVDRNKLDKMAVGGVHNGVIAKAEPLPQMTTQQLIDEVLDRGEYPFLVLADEIQYEQNLGAIMRSALGAGVHGVIVPHRRGASISPVVNRVSMGGAEAVPLIREGISSALKQIKKAGIPIIGADMGGQSMWNTPMKGALALILGGESKGLSPTLKNKCRHIVSVPLQGDLESLNVSVTAGILMFEKCRQDRLLSD